ncbi:uncharacterized protein LOC122855207 [Aphidius gifuensis]|uniref:uncharacterized protein LOC122855207 n=1 Tax=Aphidius gifuensis TaxID=684658 RepID=UPI001CDC08B8|nr:uncharacterized protein LOC122855207 [Aphidius gifuensis]
MAANINFELTLQQISTIKLAIDLWSHASIKKKIIEFLKTKGLNSINTTKNKNIELCRELIEQVKKKNLPITIKPMLMSVIKPVGDRLFNYLQCVVNRLHGPENTYPSICNYYEKIQWTSVGTIDEANTFKELYFKMPNDEIINMQHMFLEACFYCCKKLIKNIWNTCSNDDKKKISSTIDLKMIKDYYNYWKRHVYSRKSNAYKQSPAVSVPDAFTSCLLDGNVEGFKFFFNELSTNDKRAIVVPTAEVILVKYVEAINHKQSSIMYIATDVKQRIDMLIFLYINMPVSEKSNFICRNKMVLLDIFIKEWPWSNSYAEILDLNPLTTLEYGRLIVSIMNVVIDEFNQLGKSSLTSLWMLVYTYDKLPVDEKASLVEIFWESSQLLTYKLQAIALIISVIDDDGVATHYDEIIKGFERASIKILLKDHYEIIDIFMKSILKTDEERKQFMEKIKTHNICRHFIVSGKYKEADKFLNWRFNNDNDKSKFKQNLRNNQYCITIICRIWDSCKNLKVETIKPIFEKFFKWINFTEKEMNELKKKIKNDPQVKIHLKKYYLKCPYLYITLLDSCSFTPEEIDEMQVKIASESETPKTKKTPKTYIKIIRK